MVGEHKSALTGVRAVNRLLRTAASPTVKQQVGGRNNKFPIEHSQ